LKSDRLRQFLNLEPAVQIALYQGNLQDNRSLDTLVRAATFLEKNIVIVLMGKGVGSTQVHLEALIASEGVGDRVKIIPPVPYAELLEWTASADIGLITYSPNHSTSVRLCLPNKLFEYLMAGLPVLASPLDAVAELLKTYEVGQIVSSLAPCDIGAAISGMLADSAARMRMHYKTLEITRHELCWEKECQHLIRLYQSILKRK
jgi:glycosyltransferase involved in cell wall biosynthesis